MADETISQGQDVIIGGSENLKDSDFVDLYIPSGLDTVKVGMFVAPHATIENNVALFSSAAILMGVVIAPIIRPSDAYIPSDALTGGQWVKVLKPTGGRAMIRGLVSGGAAWTTDPALQNTRISGINTGITTPSGTGCLFVGGTGAAIDGNIRLAEQVAAPADAVFSKMYF